MSWVILIICAVIVMRHFFFVWPSDWISDLIAEIQGLPEKDPDRCLPR